MNGETKLDTKASTSKNARKRNSTRQKRNNKKQKQQEAQPLQSSPAPQPPPMPIVLQVDTVECKQAIRVVYQDKNGQTEELNSKNNLQNSTMNSDNALSGDTQPKPNTASVSNYCKLCDRNDEVCVNLQDSDETVLKVSEMVRFPSWRIREILECICSKCLLYMSTLTESSSKFRMRFEQAMLHQSIVHGPPTPDTSPNNFLQGATTLNEETTLNLNTNRYYCGNAEINDLPTVLPQTSPPILVSSQPTFAANSRSPSPSAAGHNSMLEILHERPVSPLNTESGGVGKLPKRSYQRVSVIPVQMICSYCNRAYWRKDYYNKHMRRCGAKNRYAKSLGGAGPRSRSASRLDIIDTVSVISEGDELITTIHQPRIFRCNDCAVTVDSISKLRKHKRIHLQHYNCDICNREFTTQNEYDFHRAECTAKLEVIEKCKANAIDNSSTMPARRKTRSYSRAASVAPSLAPSIISTPAPAKKTRKAAKKKETPIKEKPNRKEPQEKPTQKRSEDVQSTITNFVNQNQELYTDDVDDVESGAVRLEGLDDDEDDDVSQVDTLYSKRLSLTNHWVEEHSHSSHSDYMDDHVEDIPIISEKEYDLHLLNRLKVEVTCQCLTCFVPECNFTTNELSQMMLHDYVCHFKKGWFYCSKCGHCFTRKVFLDYHVDLQNKGYYVCYKCGVYFEYQHQLDRHFIQHARQTNIRYVCHYCNYNFLDEDNFIMHCEDKQHNWRRERTFIQIDRSMTIENKVPNVIKKRKKYEVRTINMVSKSTPSKRCIPMEKYRCDLPHHFQKPYIMRNRIGQVEFRDPSNPNCVDCL